MNLNIAIVDDIAADAALLKQIITSFFEEKQLLTDIRYFSSAEAFFAAYEPDFFQLVFLDIYMNGMTGMDAAHRIRNTSDHCSLVFVTTSPDFAVESYDVKASYYLLKPFQPEKLYQILDSFQLKATQEDRYIEVISDRVPVRVPLHSILYADTFRNAVCLHTVSGPIRSYLTFHSFETTIQDCHNFLSCYRGCIVNMDHIQEVTENGFLMDNGETVQIRKRGSATIRKAYLQYLFSSDKERSLL